MKTVYGFHLYERSCPVCKSVYRVTKWSPQVYCNRECEDFDRDDGGKARKRKFFVKPKIKWRKKREKIKQSNE